MAFHRVSYKQTCILCRKNKVLISSYKQKPICTECGMKDFAPVTEEPYKTLFDIPPELYVEVPFLRSIRSNYHKFGSLSENQKRVFKRVVDETLAKKKGGTQPVKSIPLETPSYLLGDQTPPAPVDSSSKSARRPGSVPVKKTALKPAVKSAKPKSAAKKAKH